MFSFGASKTKREKHSRNRMGWVVAGACALTLLGMSQRASAVDDDYLCYNVLPQGN
jgi:hypothetical protein